MPRAHAQLIGLALGCFLGLAFPAASMAGSGGSSATPVPVLSEATCRTDCAGVRAPRPGSVVRLTGRDLDAVDSVIFLGARGARDDVEVAPAEVMPKWLEVTVPHTAQSGRVAVVNLDGAQSKSPAETELEIGPAADRSSSLRASTSTAIEVEMQGKRVYFDGARKATLVYLVHGTEPANVTVELVRLADGVPIARWAPGVVEPGTPQTVVWNGTADGTVQRDGRYQFRVYAEGADGVRAQSAQSVPDEEAAAAPGEFTFMRHKFPIRGAHDYGEFAATFGGGRGHQGHDVFAACGTPLVAARGGIVKHRASHGRAGNYLVIDGQTTGTDYVYMHLRDPALPKKGDRVRTGDPIGFVGDTGRAHGCHLHFELWNGPGWYTGGSAFDPLPLLRAWDAHS
jgi:hypothetical protein